MSNLTASEGASALLKEKAMNIKPKILYPSLIVAAFSVTLLSLTGVAALTGYLPGASAKQDGMQGEPVRAAGPDKAAACAACGTVESVRLIERQGSSSGLGAVAGGVAGAILGNQVGGGSGRTVMTIAGGAGGAYVGNEVEKNSKRSSAYQIKVRMADGSMQTLTQREVPNVNSGDRVRISNGVIAEVL